jgi:ribosomal protein L11 methyltransferase
MRSWPALEVGRLKAAPTADAAGPRADSRAPAADSRGPTADSGGRADPYVGTGFGDGRPELFEAALTDYDVAAVEETSGDSWRVFFHDAAERDRAAAALATAFPGLHLAPADVADEDWAARSQADLRAIRVGNVIVAPPWDVPTVVTIQPSMGFGTGHHATTRLCLAALQRIDLSGKTVIDVGTGSGVLAIAASLLGAGNVIAMDDDPDAVQAARENIALNPRARVVLRLADLRQAQTAWADVVLANLTGGLLVSAASQLGLLTGDGGRLILSGFAEHEEAGVRAAFAHRAVEHRGQEDEWVCVTLR